MENLPPPEVIAQEIVEDPEAAARGLRLVRRVRAPLRELSVGHDRPRVADRPEARPRSTRRRRTPSRSSAIKANGSEKKTTKTAWTWKNQKNLRFAFRAHFARSAR